MKPIFSGIYVFLLLLIPFVVFSQQSNIQVIDNISKEPVAFVNIILTPLVNNTIIAGYVTDIDGYVLADIKNKSIIKLSYVGYRDYSDTISPGENKTIYLQRASYNVDEVVVTGQYEESRQDKSIYKVQVINSRAIQNRGAVNLKEILSTELNIRIEQDNALGSSIIMQGLGGEHIKFLIDGVPVIGRDDGNIDLDQLNLQNVDHIEIVNGPMSVAYGSNALAGVINIITKSPDRLLYSSSLDTYYESVGNYNINMSASGRANRNSFGFTAGRNFFDGYQAPGTEWESRWKPKEQWNFTGDYKYNWDKSHISLGAIFFNQELRDNGELIPKDFVTRFDKYFFTQRFVLKSNYKYKFSANSRINAIASYSYYHKVRNTYFNDLTTLEKNLVSWGQDTTRFNDIMFRADYSQGSENSILKFQTGIDFNYETAFGKKILDNEQGIGNYAAYGTLNYTPISLLNIQTGIRLIHNTKYKAPVVYSVNAKYDISEFLSIRASLATGFRAPSLKELYLDFVDSNHDIHGNQDLIAETALSTNVFIQYTSSAYRKYIWGIDVNLFYNNIKDNIQLIPGVVNNTLYSYYNVDRFMTKGAEINFNNNVYPWLTIKFGYALTGQKIETQGLESSGYIYYSGFNTTATYTVTKWDLNFSVYYKYNGKFPEIRLYGDDVLEINYIHSYNTLDLTASKWFWKRRINLQMGGKNLFDNTNIAVDGSQQGGIHSGGTGSQSVSWGRTFFVRLLVTINK